MPPIEIMCPVCEKDISLTEREIKLAVRAKTETGGMVLVSCPECCRALRIASEIPDDIAEWIAEAAEDPDTCCPCVPMLDPVQEQIPNGSYADLGVTFYRPGGGGKPMKKRPYMATYGINPECHTSKNPSMGGKPFKIGD